MKLQFMTKYYCWKCFSRTSSFNHIKFIDRIITETKNTYCNTELDLLSSKLVIFIDRIITENQNTYCAAELDLSSKYGKQEVIC